MGAKDLVKPEFKIAVEKMQSALGQVKPSTALSFNRRVMNAFLKSLIDPREVLDALKDCKEWLVSLIWEHYARKFKSVKRTNPTPTDDLDTAQAFLRQDIEHGVTSWETWYRLAQVFDAKIEDSLVWNALKINEQRSEITILERNAINAYTMAAAAAMRGETNDQETITKIQDMYYEFGARLYASSRPPLNMEAFATDKVVRHLSHHETQQMSKTLLIKPMSKYTVWKLAARLVADGLATRPQSWQRPYLLSKCLWKMYQSNRNNTERDPVEVEDVVEAVEQAVKLVPKKEKSSEPILEPHLRLVSVVHKLQVLGDLETQKAAEVLKTSHYAANVDIKPDEDGILDWDRYVLDVLKKLQAADKLGWHHRIFARAAHVIFGPKKDVSGALGAKAQMTQQIFTKTMTLQVWKPENERAGRHYVYTGEYLKFFVEVLFILKDRSNLEQVVRRIRRKTTDFINHTQIWEDTVTVYVKLLRTIGEVPRGRERELFDNVAFDQFVTDSERLEKWAHDHSNTSHHLDILHDAVELKKLNNSLMKNPMIDDLIGDTY
ncbi:Histone transcription regulator 3, partial [Elasticomyces elasticus]